MLILLKLPVKSVDFVWCVCVRSDEQHSELRGSVGESGERRSDHTEQTESPQRPQALHDPPDHPPTEGPAHHTGSKLL